MSHPETTALPGLPTNEPGITAAPWPTGDGSNVGEIRADKPAPIWGARDWREPARRNPRNPPLDAAPELTTGPVAGGRPPR